MSSPKVKVVVENSLIVLVTFWSFVRSSLTSVACIADDKTGTAIGTDGGSKAGERGSAHPVRRSAAKTMRLAICLRPGDTYMMPNGMELTGGPLRGAQRAAPACGTSVLSAGLGRACSLIAANCGDLKAPLGLQYRPTLGRPPAPQRRDIG